MSKSPKFLKSPWGATPVFFKGILWCSQSGDYPEKNLAKFCLHVYQITKVKMGFPQKELFSKISVLILELGLGLVLVLEQKLMIGSNFEILLLYIV